MGRHLAPALILVLATLLLTALGCSRPMGMTCTGSGSCGEGVCLKGVCSGYECTTDEGCTNDHVCGSVDGVDVCVLECSDDGDCAGEQTCEEVAETLDDDSPTNFICL
jgi:hypothetical protein